MRSRSTRSTSSPTTAAARSRSFLVARHPARVRSLLLTNCDVHTEAPPAILAPVVAAAQRGTYADEFVRHLVDKPFARSAEGIGGICYADPATLTDEAIEYYFSPLLRTSARRAQFNRYISSFLPNPLPAIEPRLAAYRGPVRVLWGEDDRVFDKSWAAWLDRTFPGSRGIRWVSGGKLFFPEEFPDVVTEGARRLWNAR